MLDPAELLDLPIFENVSGTFLELNQKAVVKRHFKAGETVCREGEFGSTAFYILEGRIDIEDILDRAKIRAIEEAVEQVGGMAMTPIKKMLGEGYTFGDIRLVMAHMVRNSSV